MSHAYAEKMIMQRVIVKTICDGCGRSAPDMPDDWYSFHSHHSDWGNDSIESYENHDVCSLPCYLRVVRERLEYWSDAPSVTVDDKSGQLLQALAALAPPRVKETP